MEDIDPAEFDAIYFTGGHAVMWDFPNSEGLQKLTRAIYERGGIVSSVCHGYCGLLKHEAFRWHGARCRQAGDGLFVERRDSRRGQETDAL